MTATLTLQSSVTAAPARVRIREAGPDDLERWDALVRSFPNSRVCHLQAWIRSLEESTGGTPLYLLFERDGGVVGCLPGLLQSVGPLRIFGSPREGWQSVSMGPAFDPRRITTAELMAALVPHLEARHRVRHIEMLHTGLDQEAMQAAGFTGQQVFTYRARLFPHDVAGTFRQLKDSARRNVRRAERLGLEVRFEDDERWVDEHYDQVAEVYLRRGDVISFGKPRMLACFRHMKASGNLIAVSVYLPGGRINIATGMFFQEGRELSLWTWAHRTHYRWYRATELMTWRVMQRALEAGCESFDLMGAGLFKTRLGGEPDLTKWRWQRSRPRWLGAARSVIQAGYRVQQKARGRVVRLVGRSGAQGRREAREHHPPACVLGGLDLVRALGLGGIRTVLMAPPGAAPRYSRFTRRSLPWSDPWDHPEELVETLVAFGLSEPEPPVLFYEDDRSLLLASRHRERLGRAFRFVLPDAKLVEQLVDKGRFQELAGRLGIPVPPARAFRPADEPCPRDPELDFPAVLKPLTRRNDLWQPFAGQRKAFRLDSPARLQGLWPRLAAAGVPILVQSLIPGPESRIESYHVYVDQDGHTVAEFTGRKIRTYPAIFGESSALEITAAPDVAALGRDIVRRLKLRGVAKLDFKRAPDGRLCLFEVNPRFTLWHHLAAVAGVNIPALVYGDLVGRVRPPVPPARAGLRWCKPWTDWPAAREQGIPLHRWLRWVLGCEARSGLAWDDPLPPIGAAFWRWRTRSPETARREPVVAAMAEAGSSNGR